MKNAWRIILTAAQVTFLCGLAHAQEPAQDAAALKEEIARLRQIVLDEQEVIANCMKRIDQLEVGKQTIEKGGLDKVKLGGDLRYRFERIDQDPKTLIPGYRIPNLVPVRDADSRERHRLRLRLNFNWKITDEWNAVAQLATGEGGDPVSTNQSLTGGYSKKDIWLDMLYFDYHPLKVPGLNVYGGKMKNPFYAPGKTQMIWDQDLTPEGLAATYLTRVYAPWEFGVNVGAFQIQENSNDLDSQMLGIQATTRYNFTEDGLTNLLLGVGYYDYENTEGFRTFYTSTNNFDNSLHPAAMLATAAEPYGFYAQDYNLFEAFAEFSTLLGELPVSAYGDFVMNAASADDFFDSGDGDTGWALGASLGKAVAPKSWALRYEYRDVERDAVVGAFADSDFGGGGTNAKGHVFGAEYMVTQNVRLAATYFMNELEGSDWLRQLPVWGGRQNIGGDYDRLQLDLNIKF